LVLERHAELSHKTRGKNTPMTGAITEPQRDAAEPLMQNRIIPQREKLQRTKRSNITGNKL
jgi:hypothetical protein